MMDHILIEFLQHLLQVKLAKQALAIPTSEMP
jgi:hypothetical protein